MEALNEEGAAVQMDYRTWRSVSLSLSFQKRKKVKLGAYTMKRVGAGAHLPTLWLFEPAKCPDDRTDYCLVPVAYSHTTTPKLCVYVVGIRFSCLLSLKEVSKFWNAL